MRAVKVDQLGSIDNGGLAEVADPVPGPGEVVVDVHAAPVNYVDVVTITGQYQFTPKLPYTPGKGPAGVVRAVGSAVTGLAAGDRVLAMAEYGGFAEQAVADHRLVYRIPDAMPFVDAASMSLAFDTAWMALRERARMAAGETVLVLGATGAVGAAAVQLAKAFKAGRVIAGVSSADRSGEARGAGADHVIDVSRDDLRDELRAEVHAVTDGAGVDIVIDPVGGDVFDAAIRALAWRGRLVVIGFAAGRIPTVRANYLLLKNIELSGMQISDYRRRTPELLRDCYRELFDLYQQDAVHPQATVTYPMTDWQAALRAVQARETRARVVLLPIEAGVRP